MIWTGSIFTINQLTYHCTLCWYGVLQVAAIAAMCIQPEADYRPLMTDVVQSLIPLVRAHSLSSSLRFQKQIPSY